MTDRILVVTSPDDTLLDGIRITHLALTEEQSSIVSSALLNYDHPNALINYVWKIGDKVDWLIDKVAKSHLVVFNADSESIELILGWISAQPQSYYFGTLRDLHLVNNRVIYTSNDILNLLEKVTKKHG